jgi:hypothetical protein
MKSYNEIYKEWFDGEDNVIVISDSPTGQLVIGICNSIVSIGYIINFNGNYEISVDAQFTTDWDSFTEEPIENIKNAHETLYQTMFNLLYCLNKRNIEYKFNINTINREIDTFYRNCSIKQFIDELRKIMKTNIQVKETI